MTGDRGPTLAVVIPNYNYARFVGQAIESILVQDPPADEIIVVDDESTDNSLEVIEAYADRIKIIKNPNSGQLGACSAGLKSSTADYVYFLDADDCALPGLTSKIRHAAASGPAKIQFQLLSMDTSGAVTGSRFPFYPDGYDAKAARDDNATIGFYLCPVTSANVFKRAALQALGLESLNQRDFIDGTPAMVMPYLGDLLSINEPLAWLNKEIDSFNRRWTEALPKLNLHQPPFGAGVPLYIRERQMMIACNDRRIFLFSQVLRFAVGVVRTHLPAKQKAMLSAWALALLVPIQSHRDRWIKMRRSSANRSQRMRRVLEFVLRARSSRLS
jgi:glycosyltransferase involved in cell wall biosynthesis